MKKKRRVPDVLWRLYGNRACTLADTIVSLLPLPPPSPADCWCKGCGCLGCSGDGAMSFLLRSDDPPDYHKLLNRCFVVMPDDQLQRRRAFYPECRWSQLTMVRRTIEMIMCESRQPSNLICSGYNKLSRASSVLDLLTTSPWCLLLERIGDDTMFHLLKYASIFLLHSRANYHRVAGPLVIDLMPKVQKHTSGSHKKRKRVNGEDKCTSDNINCLEQSIESNGELQLCGKNTTTKTEKCLRPLNWQHRTEKFNMVEDEDKDISDNVNSLLQSNISLTVNCFIGSGTCSIGCNHINCFKSFGWRCWRKQSPSPEAYMMNYTALEDDVVKSNEEFKESSKNTTIMKRKHSRPFSWQRRRKRRQLTS